MSSLLSLVLVCLVSWVVWRFVLPRLRRSDLDKIPGPLRESFLMGNLGQMFHPDGWAFHDSLARDYGGVVKVNGMLGDRHIFVHDPVAMHQAIIKETDVFEWTQLFIQGNGLMFGKGILSVTGNQHRRQRKMMVPIFSTQNLKGIYPIFCRATEEMCDVISSRIQNASESQSAEVDMLKWTVRLAIKVIGEAGLGTNFDTLNDEPNAWVYTVQNLVPTLFSMFVVRQLLTFVSELGPRWLRRTIVCLTPWRKLQRMREMVDNMDSEMRRVYEMRKLALETGDSEALSKQIGEGKDLLTALMRANEQEPEAQRLPELELVGQMSTLLFAGTDTTSGTMARILHLLALHPAVQDRLRQEMLGCTGGSRFPHFDELSDLPYLDAVCKETLRLYPPFPFVTRTTMKATVLQLSQPMVDINGSLIHSLPIPKNTNVYIGLRAANTATDVWGENADEWNPERWISNAAPWAEKSKFPGVYANTMTFLGGKHSCVGFQFSIVETKIVVATMLAKFRFSVSQEHPVEWQTRGVQKPTVLADGGSRREVKLPLLIEHL